MNAARRKLIEKARGLVEEAQSILSECASEERDYYDNMPESFQNGEKGEKADAAATELESCDDLLSDVLNAIETALEG